MSNFKLFWYSDFSFFYLWKLIEIFMQSKILCFSGFWVISSYFVCLYCRFLCIFMKLFITYLFLLLFFPLYHNKCSWIINPFFYRQIFYGSAWLNQETFLSLKVSCLMKNATNPRIFLMLNLGVILLCWFPLLTQNL